MSDSREIQAERMKHLRWFYSNVIKLGVYPGMPSMQEKEIVLSNTVGLFLLPFSLAGLSFSYLYGAKPAALGFGVFTIILFAVFGLNKAGKSLASRFLICVMPQILLIVISIQSGVAQVENYFLYSYLFIAFTFLTLLLFHHSNDKIMFFVTLLANLAIIVFYDAILFWSETETSVLQLIENNYFLVKIPQFILWLSIVGVFHFIKKERIRAEERFQATKESLQDLNEELASQNEQFIAKNSYLEELQERHEKQTNKLESSNNELQSTKLELLKTIEKLKDAKNQLLQKEAEEKSIFEALNEHYLVAQYDLEGNLVSINTKVIELLGILSDEHFHQIKPVINNSKDKEESSVNGQYFDQVWKHILEGKAQTVELKYSIGGKIKNLATTFAPLFDIDNRPYKILAIGHDVSELIEKNDEIDKINEELKEKVHEISQQNILLNFQQGQIFDTSEELQRQKEEIQEINDSLEQRVKERTKVLEEKNKQLAEYAFINSHVLRSPVSTLMGLIGLLKHADLPEDEKNLYGHLKKTAEELDNVVFKINNAIDNGLHFDRSYLEPERDFLPLKDPNKEIEANRKNK